MAKLRFSKTELKTQRDNLKRFTRFLPTLQLKKQQLLIEVMRLNDQLEQHIRKMDQYKRDMQAWIGLFSVTEADLVYDSVVVEDVQMGSRNIAGVDIPVLEEVIFKPIDIDLFETSPWVDSGLETLKELVRLEIQHCVLSTQRELIQEELRTTTQRVNLFEKIKIPETKENIRRIQIYLGDQQTNAVGRAKIAKSKLVAMEDA